ncbi:MAG: AAA domain-containing protein, partial [Mycobacteriales bacterium]
LRQCGEALAAHDVVAAIAGDTQARGAVAASYNEIDPQTLDQTPPEREFLILDTDSSQQRIVAAVGKGQHAVIHGPPGTGKSQTIANLIASLAAEGQRILFVAEKRAALEVVRNRLENVGLAHLVLDLHGADITRRKIVQRFSETLDAVRSALPVPTDDIHRHFEDRRDRLNRHVQRLHSLRQPSGLSVYQMQGRLLRFPQQINVRVRWRGSDLDKLTSQNASIIRDLLVEGAGFAPLLFRADPSPWTGANLPDGTAAQRAIDLVGDLLRSRIPAWCSAWQGISDGTGLPMPRTFREAEELSTLIHEVSGTEQAYGAELWGSDLDELITGILPARRGTLAGAWALCTSTVYR